MNDTVDSQLSPHSSSSSGTVLLVDGDVLTREAIRYVLESAMRIRVVGEASTMAEALSKFDQYKPNFVVTEIDLAGPSGLELLFEISRRNLSSRTIVLARQRSDQLARRAFDAGSRAYVLKSDSMQELRSAFDKVRSGKMFVSPQLSINLDGDHAGDGRASNDHDPLCTLSPREREIFHLLASGMQNSTIAKKLFISPRTVETHRARVVRKLSLNSNAELIRFAIRHGLTTL